MSGKNGCTRYGGILVAFAAGVALTCATSEGQETSLPTSSENEVTRPITWHASNSGQGGDCCPSEDDPCAPADPCAAAADGPDTILGELPFEKRIKGFKERYNIPIGLHAWHWFAEDLSGPNDGYGIPGLRGTYWWGITADPEADLGGGRKVGGHLEYRLRDGDTFRSFFDSKFWSYEAYGYVSSEEMGTLKAGQVWKRFGLDWDGVFFGNQPYFDGFKLDPDYGLSWEKTTAIDDRLSVDSFVQYYFHEDGVNGSFGGADPESVAGYNEENTGVIRLVPTWTFCDESTLALGASGLVGQVNSDLAGLPDDTLSAWALDATYTTGPWKVFGEVFQSYGLLNPQRYTSLAPNNKLTGMLAGAHYTRGPVVYRCSYSASHDANPATDTHLIVGGATIHITKNIDLYFEYVLQQVNNRELLAGNTDPYAEFFDSLNWIIYWNY